MITIGPERFAEMVDDALASLPGELARMMRNVAVVVEDGTEPGLLGLYEGVPLTARLSDYSMMLPDKITIFRLAICAHCDSEDAVINEVQTTVVHEVGHHFGIDDDRLHQLGW